MPADAGFDVTDEQLRKLWGTLSAAEQQSLLSCSKKHLFEEIRCASRASRESFAACRRAGERPDTHPVCCRRRYCSRCYGLFALRHALSQLDCVEPCMHVG